MKNDPSRGIGVKSPEFTSKLFTRSMDVMGKSLALRQGRHGMITTNLANQDTPGYRVRDVKFEKIMAEAVSGLEDRLGLEYTHVNHMPNPGMDGAYRAAQRNVKFSIYGTDEKGQDMVDIDQEMTKLSKNQLIYNATVQMLAKEFELLKYAISEGGR
jgi:flagellar basal-body rod protein FlgB